MRRDRNRTKKVQEVINEVNNHFRICHVKDFLNSDEFNYVCDYLIEKRMYRGFNFYKEKSINGTIRLVLAGSSDPKEYDCIQIC